MIKLFFYGTLLLVFSGCSHQYTPAKSDSKLLHAYTLLEKSNIDSMTHSTFGIETGWNIYKDIMFAGTNIEGNIQHDSTSFPGQDLLACRITGGDAYNNIFFTNTLAKQSNQQKWIFDSADRFSYQMDFYVDTYLDSIYPNRSELEGIEFTVQKAAPPYSNIWALQWSKSDQWCYWDDKKIQGKPRGWVKIPALKIHIRHGCWNQLRINGHLKKGNLYYDSLIYNGVKYILHKKIPKAFLPADWAENYIQVGLQINGNKAVRTDHSFGVDPALIYIDHVKLEIYQNIKALKPDTPLK